MQSYEEAPPPYPGTIPNAATNVVTSKGNYKGVPVYEMGSNEAPLCKFCYFLQNKINTCMYLLRSSNNISTNTINGNWSDDGAITSCSCWT